jgi:hypothetical protein
LTFQPIRPKISANGAPSQLIGQTISHYRILEKVGRPRDGRGVQGGECEARSFCRPQVPPRGRSQGPTSLSRFQREAKAASALNHPNICTIICGPPQRKLEFFHRIGTSTDDWWRMIRDASDFTTFATVWRRSWFVSEPIQRLLQTLLRHSDVKLTPQPCCQPGPHGRGRGNAKCDSQPRSGSKRTESGLKKIC